MIKKKKDFSDLDLINLLANIWCFMEVKREKNYWQIFDIYDQ